MLGGIQTHSGSLSVTLLAAQQTRERGWKKTTDDILDSQPD